MLKIMGEKTASSDSYGSETYAYNIIILKTIKMFTVNQLVFNCHWLFSFKLNVIYRSMV